MSSSIGSIYYHHHNQYHYVLKCLLDSLNVISNVNNLFSDMQKARKIFYITIIYVKRFPLRGGQVSP